FAAHPAQSGMPFSGNRLSFHYRNFSNKSGRISNQWVARIPQHDRAVDGCHHQKGINELDTATPTQRC
ncbi:MAG: hypothetical protein LJE91_03580, partial [Gammaproteobacteria bacterium]|nr:hypothetical protein [Gammaproteobacteria bacterium]